MSKKTSATKPEVITLTSAAAKAQLTAQELQTVQAWLLEWLTANVYAKLGQGGHAETGVALRQVFVDLPVSSRAYANVYSEDRKPFLAQFLAAPGIHLAGAPIDQSTLAEPIPGQVHRLTRAGRIQTGISASLLIGGPGQGKSTLGQFACQLHRVALLEPFMAALPASQQELLQSFLPGPTTKATTNPETPKMIDPPAEALFPLQISLPDLAGWLAKEPVATETGALPTILRFLADQPSAKNVLITTETLARICASMPCLLVLDGFDEVGAKEDRERIVAAAREMLAFFTRSLTPCKILATTRPQGYAGELAHIGIPLTEQFLALLNETEALEYAATLVAAKIPGQDDQKKALDRLKEAAAEPATKRLMSTPLQVTILTALVQQLGRAPRERWNLFSKYFEYTYNREIERNTYASRLLADHKMHIVQIHAHVALLLQVEAERSGGSAARMPMEQLQEVIVATLTEDGIAEDDCVELVRDIVKAAEERLVFLVTPEPNSFGFEIRSLQEFMAAWALTTGSSEKTKERLQVIAKASMFRNVLLFAASRLYSEVSDLRAVFPTDICNSVEEGDELARLSCAGAVLALETLEEGSALNQPKHARALMQRALPLLALAPIDEHERLGRIANKDTAPILQKALAAMLSHAPLAFDGIGAWLCLQSALEQGETWPLALIDWCPKSTQSILNLGDFVYNNKYYLIFLNDLKISVVVKNLLSEDWKPEALREEAWKVMSWNFESLSTAAKLSQLIDDIKQARTHTKGALLDMAILQIGLGTLTLAVDDLLQNAEEIARDMPEIWHDLLNALMHNKMPLQWQTTLLHNAYTKHQLPVQASHFAISHMRDLLQNRQSGLATPATWDRLDLPKPYPPQAQQPTTESEIPAAPIQIDSIDLQNIRGLHHLQLAPAKAEDGQGQWVVILGQNGVGKTTLLRSLALALRNAHDPTIWPAGAFSNTWLRQDNHTAVTDAKISITLNGGATHQTVIKQNGSTSISQYPTQKRARVVPLFAYGCRRGSALGGASRKLDLSENEGPEIATLFDTGADIIHAETWLTKLDSAASKDPANAALFETVLTALCSFLDVQDIKLDANGIIVTEHNGCHIPFEMLSDGYLTSAGWFLDLIARWLTLAQKHRISITPDFMQTMRGLVLIDEIDLHLHPAWQIEIIARTRKALPQMSFIVTTHNPLTLVGAKADEIWMLERDGEKVVVKGGDERPMFLTGGQIYRQYFGIEDIYPNKLGRDIKRYEFLTGFAQRNDAEQTEMEHLQTVLLANEIELDWEIVPRDNPPSPPPTKKPRTRKTKGAQ